MIYTKQPRHDSNESFFEVLQRQDELGAVLRSHFQIDARLQRVLESLTPHAGELPDLRYEQKAHLAVALGLDPRMLPAVQMLGHLRDSAAKNFDVGLSDAAVSQWFGLLAKNDREAVLRVHRERIGGGSYQQASVLQRFIAIAAIVDQFLAAAEAGPRGGEAAHEEDAEPDLVAQAEVITFEWSAPATAPRRVRDFSNADALYSHLIANDWS